MIKYLEANLTGNPIDDSDPDNLAVDEEQNSEESPTTVSKASNEIKFILKKKIRQKSIKRQ